MSAPALRFSMRWALSWGLWLASLALFWVALMVVGQALGPLRHLVQLAAPALELWTVFRQGALVLMEGALPLLCVLAAGLAAGRLRAEGGWAAFAALGGRPRSILAPTWIIATLLAGAAAWVAHGPGPRALAALGADLRAAAASGVSLAERPVSLPGGGVARRDASGAFWAVLPQGREVAVLRAAQAHAQIEADELQIALEEVWISQPRLHLRSPSLVIKLDAAQLSARLGQFQPPNASPTADLDRAQRHHRFVAARRSAQPAAAPVWAWLGLSLGIGLGGLRALLGGAALVAGAYHVLRMGELAARAGFGSPELAAWAPTLILLGLAALAWPRAWRRVG